MAVYLIGAIDIEDQDRYAQYIAMADGSVPGSKLVPLAVDDHPLLLEGELPAGRIILMQFETVEDMNRWYVSERYEAAKQHRHASAKTHFLVAVEGGFTGNVSAHTD